jgi:hypothetical protein
LQAIDPGAPSERLAGCRPDQSLPKFSFVKPCVVGAAGDPSVMFMGDSHALMLTPVAEWSARAASQSAVVLGVTTCPPLQGIDVDYFSKRTCLRNNNEILAWLATAKPPITGAVLAARWSFYNEQPTPARDAMLPRLHWSDAKGRDRDHTAMLATGLTDLMTSLTPERRLLIVGPVPELKHPVENCLKRAQLTGQPPQSCAVARTEVERRHRETWQALRSVASKFPNARLIDPVEAVCDRETCWPFGPKGLLYLDKDHLSPLGTEMLYRHFERDFRWVYGDSPAR